MGFVVQEVRALLSGVMFLTRLPVPRWTGHSDAALARSTAYFPLVGALVGAVGAAAYWFAHLGLTPLVAALLAVMATVYATGAFHEDALADAADGFGGGREREQVLAIMKDSRVGSYGAVAVALALALRAGALASLAPNDALRALVAAHALARWSSLPLIFLLPYARDDGGKSRPFAASVSAARLAAGTALAAVAAGLALGRTALPATFAALLVTLLAARYFRRRIAGITGDCLGAANQAVEIAVYLAVAWRP